MSDWWVIVGTIALTLLAGCAIGLLTDHFSTPPELRKQTAPAKQRTAMHPSGPPHPGVCPICGMDDPDHLETRWRTHPAHTDCLDWLMPAGPPFVDEYNNPALGGGGPKRANILGGVTAAEASAALAAMFATAPTARDLVNVATLGDARPVYIPGAQTRHQD